MQQTVAGRAARGRSERGKSAHSKSQARTATKRHPAGPGLASISPHVSRERPLPAQVTQGARRYPTAGRPPLAQVTERVRLYPTAAGRPSLAQVTGGVRLYPTAGRPSLAQITGGGGVSLLPTARRPSMAQVTGGVRLYPTAAGRPSRAQVTGRVRLYPTAGRPSLARPHRGPRRPHQPTHPLVRLHHCPQPPQLVLSLTGRPFRPFGNTFQKRQCKQGQGQGLLQKGFQQKKGTDKQCETPLTSY